MFVWGFRRCEVLSPSGRRGSEFRQSSQLGQGLYTTVHGPRATPVLGELAEGFYYTTGSENPEPLIVKTEDPQIRQAIIEGPALRANTRSTCATSAKEEHPCLVCSVQWLEILKVSGFRLSRARVVALRRSRLAEFGNLGSCVVYLRVKQPRRLYTIILKLT